MRHDGCLRRGVVQALLTSLALWAGEGGRAADAPPQCQDVPTAGWYGVGREWEDLAQFDATPWGTRSGYGFAVAGGRFVVFGGEDSEGLKNDVFVSSDGAAWARLHTTSAWEPRANFLHVVLGDSLYVFSGRGCGSFCKDVFRATVPSVGSFQLLFEKVGELPRSGRQRGLAVPLQGRIYDIGGCSTSGCFVEILMAEPDSMRWYAVSVEGEEPGLVHTWWNADIVGKWPNIQEYRVVGTAHSDSIYVFGGQPHTKVLRLTPSSFGAGGMTMKLSALPIVGTAGEIKRAYALSFLSTLWLATGLEDNGAGTSNLFYTDGSGSSWSRQSESLPYFTGRLQGGVVFMNRLCLLLGDGVGAASRWKVTCARKPQFPELQISYTSENVGQAGDAVVLRDPATLRLQHAVVPPGVKYLVKYYAGAYNPDSPGPGISDYVLQNTRVAENCSHEFTYKKKVFEPTALIISMTVEFDVHQAFISRTTRRVWTIKMTHSPPVATSEFLKTETIMVNGQTTTQSFQAISISCKADECGGAGAIRCRIAYRQSHTIDSHNNAGYLRCGATGPCDVNIQDPTFDMLFHVQARCENDPGEWISSSWVWFEKPVKATPSLNPMATSAVQKTDPSVATSTPRPAEPPPPPRIPQITSWDVCCQQTCDPCSVSTRDETTLMLKGYNLDRVSRVSIGAQTLSCSTPQSSAYTCSIPPGLGTHDLTVGRPGDSDWVVRCAIIYPLPRVSSVVANLLETAGGSAVTLRGTNLGGVVFSGFKTDKSAPWNIPFGQVQFRVSASIGGTRAAGVAWVSDSEMILRTPHGVGSDRCILLSIHGTFIEPAGRISYVAPQLVSLDPSIGPDEGGIRVSLIGQFFGYWPYSDANTRIFRSDCSATTWISDSAMICISPKGELGAAVPATVAVGGQIGVKQGAYQYTIATDKVVFVLAHSPTELQMPASGMSNTKPVSRLESFRIWLKAILGLKEASQIYIDDVQEYAPSATGITLRAGSQKSKLTLRFFASPQDPSRAVSAVLKDLEFLATSLAGFADSGLEVNAVQLQPGGKVIQVKDGSGPDKILASPKTADAASSANLGSPLVAGAIVGSLILTGLVAAACYVYWRRRHLSAGPPSGSGNVDITARPNDIRLPSMASSVSHNSATSGRSRVDVRAESVFAPSPKASRSGSSRLLTNDMCEQCRNSGFAVCLHRTMGLVEKPLEEEEEDALCVVCLEGPREALIVHADEAKSSHRVLCLACAYKILEQGGSCPLCRKSIFAVFKAKTRDEREREKFSDNQIDVIDVDV